MAEAYIVSALRTAGGRRKGRLAGWHPADLGGAVIDATVQKTGVDPALVEDVIFGCVTQAGEQSQNVARGAILSSILPETTPGVTVDRQCGSSQQAIHFAAQAVLSGTNDIVLAGGVESMTRVPMLSASTVFEEQGYGSYISRGMAERYPGVVFSQFTGAEIIAKQHGLQKAALDQFALESHLKAIVAINEGRLAGEIVPLQITLPDGTVETHLVDEGVRFNASLESIAGVKLLSEDGRHTAASASQICDGASAVLIVNERGLKTLGVEPLARIHHLSALGGDPVAMLDVPLAATARALAKAGLSIDDIDLFEVNEAFAAVPLAWLKATGADPAKLNVNGGSIALGHPLGGTGAKLMATLVHELRRSGKRYGLQTMCEGGGMANVTIIERL